MDKNKFTGDGFKLSGVAAKAGSKRKGAGSLFKRILSILLVAALILVTVPDFSLTASANTHTWNGSSPPTTVVDGDTVNIAGTISGTLNIPQDATVTITGTASASGAGGTSITIGENATVIWKATLTNNDGSGGAARYLARHFQYSIKLCF